MTPDTTGLKITKGPLFVHPPLSCGRAGSSRDWLSPGGRGLLLITLSRKEKASQSQHSQPQILRFTLIGPALVTCSLLSQSLWPEKWNALIGLV